MGAREHMIKIINALMICALMIVFSGCSSKQYQVLFQEKKALSASDTLHPDNQKAEDYRIRSQDILQVRNLQDAKRYLVNTAPSVAANTNVLTDGNTGTSAEDQTFQVADDGNVILPVIGPIKVSGYTRAEAQKLVEIAYRKNVLVNPIIELKVINLKVTILGEVRSPGNYPLSKEHTTLVEMIGAAGGITEKANESNVKIIRATENKPKVLVVDLGDISSVSAPVTALQNGDIIYVGQNKRAARSENLQNFSTVFQPLLLLFNTALIVFTLTRR